MSNETDRPMTSPQMVELSGHLHAATAQALQEYFEIATFAEAQSLLTSGRQLRDLARRSVTSVLRAPPWVHPLQREYLGERQTWQDFYDHAYHWSVDLSSVIVPPRPSGEFMLVFVPPHATQDGVRECLGAQLRRQNMGEGVYTSAQLSMRFPMSMRIPREAYAVWVGRSPFAPEANFGHSAQEVDGDHTRGVTLLEELLIQHYSLVMESTTHKEHPGLGVLCTGTWDDSRSRCIPAVGYGVTGGLCVSPVSFSQRFINYAMRPAFAL